MQKNTILKTVTSFSVFINLSLSVGATTFMSPLSMQDSVSPSVTKEIYLPKKSWNVSENNDYNDSQNQFCYERMYSTPNIAAFWVPDFGRDPSVYADSSRRFDIKSVLAEGERFYNYYVDVLKFAQKGNSLTDKYKMLMYIFNDDDGTAYGGGEEQKIGAMWFRPSRMKDAPYCTLAHEMGHSFQYMLHADGAWAFTSANKGSNGHSIFEMTSQWMLWQVYPDWITIENYHLEAFMKKTHYAFLHETNMYHSPFVLEYWSNKHGLDIIGRIWREAVEGEDVVAAYKRLTNISQETFNDQIFDASRRFVTWDMDRVREVSKKYANRHICKLSEVDKGWFRVAEANCPQNYGYNAIGLKVPSAGTRLKLDFRGIAGITGFRSINADMAGWRYGFVAYTESGERIYSNIYSDKKGQAVFAVPANTTYLWLVVSGAPTRHWEHLLDGDDANDEQWPYEVKISGTDILESFIL